MSLGPPQHATRAHRRTFSKPHGNSFLNLKEEFTRLWNGIIEVLQEGVQFGDTFFEGRGDAGVFKAREPKGANIRLTAGQKLQ